VDLRTYYLRWKVRSIAYFALFRDEYPPFGDGDYPASLALESPSGARPKLSVALRLIYAIPHLVILAALVPIWVATTLIAWVVIVLTGCLPDR